MVTPKVSLYHAKNLWGFRSICTRELHPGHWRHVGLTEASTVSQCSCRRHLRPSCVGGPWPDLSPLRARHVYRRWHEVSGTKSELEGLAGLIPPQPRNLLKFGQNAIKSSIFSCWTLLERHESIPCFAPNGSSPATKKPQCHLSIQNGRPVEVLRHHPCLRLFGEKGHAAVWDVD